MGFPTSDKQNPGRRQVQSFSVAGGLTASRADHVSKPVSFLILKNCLVDKRLGGVVRRPGSTTETIASSLGVPNGMGEFKSAAVNSGLMPVNRSVLAAFGGTLFYEQSGTAWTQVATTAYVDFSTSKQFQMRKLGGQMYIAGGKPAKWGGPGTTIDQVGLPTPTLAPVRTGFNAFGQITLIDGAQYVYTLYNSTTGLESDWSPFSSNTGPTTNYYINLSFPALPTANYDKIRLYRTYDGGLFPYLVATLDKTTLTYEDNTPDELLTAKAPTRYKNKQPPTSYICEKYGQCIWYVDAANPYKLVFSEPYIGSDVDNEYYPLSNYVMSNEPVTGLFAVAGKMFVFHPRSISYISGTSKDDFNFQTFITGTGTLFANSISGNGVYVSFLGEQGIVSIDQRNNQVRSISREIDLDLQPILAGSYNSSFYFSSVWNPSLKQFIYLLSAVSTAGAPWEVADTGVVSALSEWEDSVSLTTELWEDIANPNSSAVMKTRIWGWSPELSSSEENIWHEYTHHGFADGNTSNAYPTVLLHPEPGANTNDPQQDKTYIGYFNGAEGKVLTFFRRDKNQDDSTTYTAALMTDRLYPGEDTGGYRLYKGIGFTNSYSDPTSDSLATIKYLTDFDDPHLRSFTGSLISVLTTAEDIKKFPSGLGRHVHIYIEDTSQSQTKILLSEFFLHFRERFRRQGR